MNRPLTIWLISDGKPGHENQSLGLVEAMGRMRDCEVHQISLAGISGWLGRWRVAMACAKSLPMPDMVIGAGHATHLPLLRLARTYDAKSVLLMRPSLPLGWFDFVVCPQHDFPKGCSRANVILTKGALNRVVSSGGDKSGKLILIGGPSKIHGWDAEGLLRMLKLVVVGDGWELTNSRRTPSGFLDKVRSGLPQVEVFPHEQTSSGWLPKKLQQADQVWVTEDSVSMVYEAVTSGARVGLLPAERLKEQARVLSGVDRLVGEGFVTSFDQWQKQGALSASPEPLREADRVALLLLEVIAPS